MKVFFCPNCGNKVRYKDDFCPTCGAANKIHEYPRTPKSAYTVNHSPRRGTGFGIAALVLGIFSVLSICFVYVSILTSVLGIVFSIISLVRSRPYASKNGLAIAGLICSAVTFLLILVIFAPLYLDNILPHSIH